MRATSLYEIMTNDKINPTAIEAQQRGDKLLEQGEVISIGSDNRPRVQLAGQILTCQQVTDDPAQYTVGVRVWVTRSPLGPIVHGVLRG